jgi:hypothetical protein
MEPITVNGRPLSDLGLSVSALEPWSSGLTYERESYALPGHWGSSESPTQIARPRVLRFVGSFGGVAVAARDEIIQQVEEAFTGLVEIQFGDQSGKKIIGRRAALTARPLAPDVSFALGDMDLEVEVICAQPYKFDAGVQRIGLSTARTPIPVGTLPSAGIVFLPGSWSTRSVILRDTAGAEVDRLTIANSVLSTETVRLDFWKRTAHKIAANGTETNVIGSISSGTGFFEIDPARCKVDRPGGMVPTLELDAGAGYIDTLRLWSN